MYLLQVFFGYFRVWMKENLATEFSDHWFSRGKGEVKKMLPKPAPNFFGRRKKMLAQLVSPTIEINVGISRPKPAPPPKKKKKNLDVCV